MTTPISQLPTDDEGLANLVRAMTLTAHPVGTCRQGSAEDSDAVVDNRGRAIGVAGLRIADALIFPTDRKGVVKGKTVSCRVNPAGRRNIKKNTTVVPTPRPTRTLTT